MRSADGIDSELRQLFVARRRTRARIADCIEQRDELMGNPKVARYVKLHQDERAANDELATLETRILELFELLQELRT
jgi:hypothetical protein